MLVLIDRDECWQMRLSYSQRVYARYFERARQLENFLRELVNLAPFLRSRVRMSLKGWDDTSILTVAVDHRLWEWSKPAFFVLELRRSCRISRGRRRHRSGHSQDPVAAKSGEYFGAQTAHARRVTHNRSQGRAAARNSPRELRSGCKYLFKTA